MPDARNDNPDQISAIVVDDDPAACRLLECALRSANIHVTTFTNPLAVTPWSVAWQYQIAVLDCRMPGLSGLELLGRIREYDPIVEAVVVTGQAEYPDAVAGYRAGVGAWVTKPWRTEHLLSEVKRLLARRRVGLTRLREEYLALDLPRAKARMRAVETTAHTTRQRLQVLRQHRP